MNIRRLIPILLVLAAPPAMLYTLWANPVSAGEDDVVFYYPLRKMLGAAVARGDWPLTNPLEATGGPLVADPQAAAMHPATWLFAVMNPKLAYTLSIFLAFSAAGGGACLYLRRLGLIRPAACFGAAAFMFCGFMVGHRVHLSVIHAAAMLPWMLYAIELARRENGIRRLAQTGQTESHPLFKAFAVLTPAMFLAIAGGHWPTLIHMAIICVPYALLRARPLGRAVVVCAAAAALAGAMAAPQLLATTDLLAGATRQKLGYAFAGENSFFPLSAILAMFPMIMGSRTPNFFGQTWWGPWHLCESLGYVGLVTLALAGAAVWKMYRRKLARCGAEVGSVAANAAAMAPGSSLEFTTITGETPMPRAPVDPRDPGHVGLVRAWTWISIGAFIWMLGYYLPSYRLIHMLPVLGMVRCPSRMLLAIDMALATMAALAIHHAAAGAFGQAMRRTITRMAALVLPAAMLASLLGWALIAFKTDRPIEWGYFLTGTQDQARAAFSWSNPAILVPLAMAGLTVVAVLLWLRRPAARGGLMVALVLLDLLFITRFVDVPAADYRPQDPDASLASAWLAANAPPAGTYRILTVSDGYHQRAAELLRPKACQSMGIASLGSYGPFQSPAHAQLLGMSIIGNCRDWPGLLRQNYLLSLYSVRYIITADPAVRELLDEVAIADKPAPPDGPNLLRRFEPGDLDNARIVSQGDSSPGRTLVLETPVMWRPSEAVQTVEMLPDTVYRISLDVRGPEGGAANHLRAEVRDVFHEELNWDRTGLSIRPEETGTDWRHFEWAFRTPPYCSGQRSFHIHTLSERPVEVRNISLRASHEDMPVNPRGALTAGAKIYAFRAELPPLNAGDAPVAIYENLLCDGQRPCLDKAHSTPQYIEWLKWGYPRGDLAAPHAPPDISVTASTRFAAHVKWLTIPAAIVFLAVVGLMLLPLRGQRDSSRRDA